MSCKTFSSAPDFCPLDASSTHTTHNGLPQSLLCPLGHKSLPAEPLPSGSTGLIHHLSTLGFSYQLAKQDICTRASPRAFAGQIIGPFLGRSVHPSCDDASSPSHY